MTSAADQPCTVADNPERLKLPCDGVVMGTIIYTRTYVRSALRFDVIRLMTFTSKVLSDMADLSAIEAMSYDPCNANTLQASIA